MTGQQSGGPGNLSPLRTSCLLPDGRGDQGERRQQLKSLPSSQFNYRYLSVNQNNQCNVETNAIPSSKKAFFFLTIILFDI